MTTTPPSCPFLRPVAVSSGSLWSAQREPLPSVRHEREMLGYFDKIFWLDAKLPEAADNLTVFAVSLAGFAPAEATTFSLLSWSRCEQVF